MTHTSLAMMSVQCRGLEEKCKILMIIHKIRMSVFDLLLNFVVCR